MKNQQEFLKIIEDYIERDVFPGADKQKWLSQALVS